ncbi:hypothetical protein [Burkholderia gladioli]|uniref:hypothetical protein n=1 Tax=Burkholderia gladioli TaxID=28095 RepID=UPI00163EF022|nr:hypothetical protein [Burkholderia gladioli]
MDETNQVSSTDVTQAVADSNVATTASLSTSMSASAEPAVDDTAGLSTSLSALSADQPNAESVESKSAALPANAAPLLARLHDDLEALERKIELGIHVFAHEVAAIRDQVKSLI